MEIATCYTLLILFILWKVLYTAQRIVCTPTLIVRTLLEWTDGLLIEILEEVDWIGWVIPPKV